MLRSYKSSVRYIPSLIRLSSGLKFDGKTLFCGNLFLDDDIKQRFRICEHAQWDILPVALTEDRLYRVCLIKHVSKRPNFSAKDGADDSATFE